MSIFNYNPEDANPILPEGEYDAVILEGKTGETKKGDPKLEVTVKAYGESGVQPLVTDHIVSPYGIRRLKRLCEATGVDFGKGEVDPAEFVGQNLRVRLRVEHDEAGQYDDRNVIAKYLPDQPAQQKTGPQKPVVSGPTEAKPNNADGPKLDEPGAYAAYAEAVRKDRPEATDSLLMQNFGEACNKLVPDKQRSKFTPEDWARVVRDGQREFVPF